MTDQAFGLLYEGRKEAKLDNRFAAPGRPREKLTDHPPKSAE